MENNSTLEKEKQDRTIAGSATLTINVILLLCLYFINAWTISPPPQSSYGVEVNYGTSDKGSGKIQTHNKPSDLQKEIESKPAEEKKTVPKPVVEKKVPEPVKEKVKVVKVKEAPVKVSKVESPVKVPEKPEVKKIEPTKPVAEKPKEVEPKPAEPVKTPDPKAMYKKGGGNSQSNGTTGTNPQPGGNNNGDDTKAVGDKGVPEGKINDKAIYKGSPGNGGSSGNGGNGASLNLTGWTWRSRPSVNDNSSETGRIVFKITIDDDGNILSVVTQESTVSPSVLAVYKRAVERLDFQPASSSGTRSATSTGTIVFNIRSK